MRRIALVLATLGVIAVGMAGTPAQAHEGWWGGHQWREQTWREHQWREQAWREHQWREHQWRKHHFAQEVLPQIIMGLLSR